MGFVPTFFGTIFAECILGSDAHFYWAVTIIGDPLV
jgi:hypothetical protein